MSTMNNPYDLPSEVIELPTRGKLYPATHPFHDSEEIQIKPITTKEEDILSSRALAKKGKTFDALVTSVVKPFYNNINIKTFANSLFSGDLMAIIIGARISGYGPEYKTNIVCPVCNKSEIFEYDLGQLRIKHLDIEGGIKPITDFVNEFEFVLPKSKWVVVFKLLTNGDQTELKNLRNSTKNATGQENSVTMRLLHQIVSINGERDASEKSQLINSMLGMDSAALRKYMTKHEPQVDLNLNYTCPNCDASSIVSLPLDHSFFWPETG